MSEASEKSEHQISMELNAPISLPESVDGTSLSGMQDGKTTEKSGQEAALASHFLAPAKDSESLTNAICGLTFSELYPSDALQQSLENRLATRLGGRGSSEYALTWKHWDMESGSQICAVRASALPPSDSVCIGWPSPTAAAGGPCKDVNNPRGVQAGNPIATAAWMMVCGSREKEDLVPMEQRGGLNPDLARWLMGFPIGWGRYADMETP